MRPVLAVVGSGGPLAPATTDLAEELGRRAIDAGFRLVTGGRDGVMAAASRGAHGAEAYREGDVIGVLPGYDRDDANPHVDVVIPTGLGHARNVVVVATADVVVAVAGGAGTLSEIALAWQLDKPVIALSASGGWSTMLAGQPIDDRRAASVIAAVDAAGAIAAARRALR